MQLRMIYIYNFKSTENVAEQIYVNYISRVGILDFRKKNQIKTKSYSYSSVIKSIVKWCLSANVI